MDSQAFLSSNDNEAENLAALDSMVPHSQPQPNPPPPSSEPTFSGVSESLFDRIRARTLEQQKATAAAAQSQPQPPVQQQPSEPTMEFEKSPVQNTFDAAVANASNGVPQQPNNETTYSFSGPSDYSTSVPTYGPSRNDYVSAGDTPQYPTSMKDKAFVAMNSLWDGAQNIVSSAQDRMKGSTSGGGGYNTNFLLREDGLEGGMGGSPVRISGMGGGGPQQQQVDNPEGGGALSMVSGQAYNMFSYGKTFCEDMYGFFMQLPNWGKGAVVGVLILFIWYMFV